MVKGSPVSLRAFPMLRASAVPTPAPMDTPGSPSRLPANPPAIGQILRVHRNDFYPVLYDILLDNGEEKRIAQNIFPSSFNKSPGRRFILLSEYEAERAEKIKELKKNLN